MKLCFPAQAPENYKFSRALSNKTMMQFRLRTLMIATLAVAAIAVFFRPRDLRHEIEEIARASQTFDKHDLVGRYAMPCKDLQLSSDGTYNLTIWGCGGISFVESGNWSLSRNFVDFDVKPSPMNSCKPTRWAFATIQNGSVAIIPDTLTASYMDRGYSRAIAR
jgi:hypothetical protein